MQTVYCTKLSLERCLRKLVKATMLSSDYFKMFSSILFYIKLWIASVKATSNTNLVFFFFLRNIKFYFLTYKSKQGLFLGSTFLLFWGIVSGVGPNDPFWGYLVFIDINTNSVYNIVKRLKITIDINLGRVPQQNLREFFHRTLLSSWTPNL